MGLSTELTTVLPILLINVDIATLLPALKVVAKLFMKLAGITAANLADQSVSVFVAIFISPYFS
jgi:hypothetical protein